jgi:2-keto-4-pentenoate hydratase/2-oxohepta-3-ene-1,7-dioic acid hydratase in catechol pathway
MTVWCRFEDAGQSSPGGPVLARLEIGYRANNALTGHLSPIIRPSDCDEPLVAEGELVEVIGRPLRHVTAAEAREGIFGWTIGNDVSVRGWQRSDRTFWRCKNSDTFADGAVHRYLG